MKKLLLVFALVALLATSLFAAGAAEVSTRDKSKVAFVVSGSPFRFFHLTSNGCGGDDNIVLANVYDNLLCLENDGSLSNSLAENYEISADGTTYTFYLRKGVKFTNGAPLTAEDVVWSIQKGSEGPLGGALFINYKECKIVDENTVQIILNAPYAAFPYCVASRLGGIACKAYWEEVGDDGYMKNPVGTGPYKLKEFAQDDYIVLEANEEHWRGVPKIKTVRVELVKDINTMVLGLQNGDYDVMGKPSIEIVSRFTKDENILTDVADSTGRISLYMNAWSGIGLDINFRRAVQYAIDKEEINIAVNNGEAILLDVDLCPMYAGYPTTGINVIKKDIEQAKKYLAASSYKGEPWSIMVQVGTDLETAAKVIQAQLMAIGINCQVEAIDNVTLRTRDNSREFDSYLLDNLSSLPDASAIAGMFKPTRHPQAVWYPRIKEIYNLSLKGDACPAGYEREAIYAEICNIVTDEAYIIPIYNGITTIAYNADLTGVGAHCLNYYLFRYWQWK